MTRIETIFAIMQHHIIVHYTDPLIGLTGVPMNHPQVNTELERFFPEMSLDERNMINEVYHQWEKLSRVSSLSFQTELFQIGAHYGLISVA